MSLLKALSPNSWKLGRKPDCEECAAGGLLNFRWHDSMKNPQIQQALSVFVPSIELRWGRLYLCRCCGATWYLDGYGKVMNYVPQERLSLIHQWNQRQLILSREQIIELEQIGRTPPDIYGNGSQFHETPCGVVTKAGVRIDLAIVSQQKHPPFESMRNYKLLSDVHTIYQSPHALPLAVRIATAKAEEYTMGFAPTCIETPDGHANVLNWTQNFFIKTGYKASDVTLPKDQTYTSGMAVYYPNAISITYIVADQLS